MTFQPNPGAAVPEMTVREAASHLAASDTASVLIDVRERDEYQPRHAQGAVNIPMSEFVARIGEVPQDQDVLVICEHGSRSYNVVRYLMRQGHTQAINVDGGTEMWEAAGLPMEYASKG
ncbi:MAG TPA: rhodanese-like domain-containing protein [Ktedonobacterales bacterium]